MVECLPHRSGEALQGPVLGALKQRQHIHKLGLRGGREAARAGGENLNLTLKLKDETELL